MHIHVYVCVYINVFVCVRVCCASSQSCLTLCNPMDCSPPGSSVHADSLGKSTGVGCRALLQGIFPTQGSKPGLALQVNSVPAEPPGKPKSTGVGSLSLLQWIFLTQELNQGLLHCRRILYQLSYHGSPHLWKGIYLLEIITSLVTARWLVSTFLENKETAHSENFLEKSTLRNTPLFIFMLFQSSLSSG